MWLPAWSRPIAEFPPLFWYPSNWNLCPINHTQLSKDHQTWKTRSICWRPHISDPRLTIATGRMGWPKMSMRSHIQPGINSGKHSRLKTKSCSFQRWRRGCRKHWYFRPFRRVKKVEWLSTSKGLHNTRFTHRLLSLFVLSQRTGWAFPNPLPPLPIVSSPQLTGTNRRLKRKEYLWYTVQYRYFSSIISQLVEINDLYNTPIIIPHLKTDIASFIWTSKHCRDV